MVSSISTEEPNSLIVSIFEVTFSQKANFMRVGKMNFITSLRMMVIVVSEISGLRDEFWLGKRGMLLICGEAMRDAEIWEEIVCDLAICENDGQLSEVRFVLVGCRDKIKGVFWMEYGESVVTWLGVNLVES